MWLSGKKIKNIFWRFSRPLHNLKFSQFTSLSGQGQQRIVPKCKIQFVFLFIFKFCIPSGVKATKALISMRQAKPDTCSQMTSSCKCPIVLGHHFFPSLKLTFPFLFKLYDVQGKVTFIQTYDVQSTFDFKSTSTKQIF